MFTAQGTPHRIHSWNPYGVLIDDERRWRATRNVTSAFLEHPATRVTHGVIGQVREVQYGRPQNANIGDRCRQWNLRRDELVFGSSAKPVSVPTPGLAGSRPVLVHHQRGPAVRLSSPLNRPGSLNSAASECPSNLPYVLMPKSHH